MHMRRRDVLTADIILCAVLLFLIPLLSVSYGIYSFIIVIAAIAARIIVQILIYNKHDESASAAARRTVLGIDPISFEILFVTVTAAVVIALWKISVLTAVIVTIAAISVRVITEYFWFSDRPDRWHSFRFKMYDMRRRMHPTYSERLQKILVTEVDGMKGHDFERYVAEVLTMNGFRKVKVTRGSGDYGIDVTASLDKENYAIQCKRSESKIGIKAIQEAHLGKDHYKADIAVVVTNNYFTKQAYEAAEGKVALWDRERLGGLIRKARDSLSDEKYNEEMAASESEIRMFAALFDRGKGDIRLTEKVMGTLYPAGNIRSEEDVDHFLKRVSEHIYEADGVPERKIKRIRSALEKDKQITPFEADLAYYHLTGAHTIAVREMDEVRNRLAKAFLEKE